MQLSVNVNKNEKRYNKMTNLIVIVIAKLKAIEAMMLGISNYNSSR